MAVRFLTGYFEKVDGFAADDFQALATGAIDTIPQVTGTSGCILFDGTFLPREG